MIIQIKNLKKWYRKRRNPKSPAVNDLTLSIAQGEVFGFLGPNGAGKSTVIKILMNFIRPSEGAAFIKDIPVENPFARRAIGYLPENPYFYDHLTAEEILVFAGQAAKMDKDLIRVRIDQLLERLKLAHVKRQRLRTYSKGMMQRIGLAIALIHDPEVCLLDEPMSGLDPLGRRLVADLILDIRRNGRTVFFSSHILSDVEMLCDRVGILNRGRLLFCGNSNALSAGAGGLENMFIQLVEKDEREHHGADLAAG